MLQDILFELNFKEEKIKCGLHVLFRPEISENQLVAGRPVNKSEQSKDMPCHGNYTKKLVSFLNNAIFCTIALLYKTQILFFQYNWIFFFHF